MLQILYSKECWSFMQIYDFLKQYFPSHELKQSKTFEKIYKNQNYSICEIVFKYRTCGFFSFFQFKDNTIFIDYFFIFKKFQSMGLGSKTFEIIKKNFSQKGCYIEVEKENKNHYNTIRRVKFYKNLGAKKLNINYFYPNQEGELNMDLFFLPFEAKYFPTKENIIQNIQTIFDKLHFDLPHSKEVLKKIKFF